uniref:Uncharacterized protein n=1 Tax=viral metagenome TaxID=1070528 RepID=A0A6C0JQ99_9ZZZZ
MTKKINTLKQYKKRSFWAKCLCSNNIAYFVVAIGVIIAILAMIGTFKRLSNVKEQLESCRSSCRSN